MLIDAFIMEADMEEDLRFKAEKIQKEIDDTDTAADARHEKKKDVAKKATDSNDALENHRKAMEDKLRSSVKKAQQAKENAHRKEVEALKNKPFH